MAEPVITQPATPRTIAQGVAIPTLTLVASGDPDEWVASPLPAGLSLDAEAGEITGTPITAGLVSTEITAENEDGVSDPVTLVWNVQASPPGRGDGIDHELDFNLRTRLVTEPGIATAETGEVFPVKKGDRFPLLVGLIKDGVLQDFGATVTLKLGIKELAEDPRLIEVSEPTATRVGTGDEARYRIWIRMTPAKWRSILGDYAAADESRLVARGELQLQIGEVSTLYDQTKTVTDLEIYGGIGTGGSGGTDPLEETLAFDGLTATEGASYTLTLSLIVAGRSSQNVTLTRTLTLTFTAGAWVVSALAGSATGSGAAEGTQWRVTVNNTAVAGDAAGVDVDVQITTTADASGLGSKAWVVGARNTGDMLEDDPVYLNPVRLRLLDGEGDPIGTSAAFGETSTSLAALVASYLAAWDDAGGGDVEIEIAGGTTLLITVPEVSTVVTVIVEHPTDEEDSDSYAPRENVRTATLSGQLLQVEDAGSLPTSISSRNFGIGVGDDIVPDA